MTDRLSPEEKADICLLKAVGFTNQEIAEELGVTEAAIRYHLEKLKRRAKEVSPEWALAEVLLGAGPGYPVFRFIGIRPEEVLKRWKGGEK